MCNWIKKLFNKEEKKETLKSSGSNQYYIEKYKDFDKIIKTYYQAKDNAGKLINIDGIVTPLKIDNRQYFSVIDDQSTTPHCAGYSVCGVIESLIWKRTGKLINLNADQVYAKAKTLDGSPDDNGTYLEYAYKAALELGGLGKYASNIKLGFIYNAYSKDDLKQVIKRYLHKYEFLEAGFSITQGWYDAGKNSDYKIKHYGANYGGHAVVIVGADEECAYIANSWSKDWCAKGFAQMTWDVFKQEFMYACYLQNCFDNWID